MKILEELKHTPRLIIHEITLDGGSGEVQMINWSGSVTWSFGGGWEHVSVAPYKARITPSWDDMCRLKDMFFYLDETVVQYHPAKSQYVNIKSNCLHLWRPMLEPLPVPPRIYV